MFYTYNQNNSGGSFSGPRTIIIEAQSHVQANTFAEDRTEIYFDGCDFGRDCSCCGDRWYRASDYDASEKLKYNYADIELPEDPNNLEKVLTENIDSLSEFLGLSLDSIKVYYLNGEIKNYDLDEDAIKRIKEVKKNSKNFCWGFRFAPNWGKPHPPLKVYQTEYDKSTFYDETGNNSIKVGKQFGWEKEKNEFVAGGTIYSFSAKTEQEAKEEFDKLNKALKEAKKIMTGAFYDFVNKSTDSNLYLEIIKNVYLGDK